MIIIIYYKWDESSNSVVVPLVSLAERVPVIFNHWIYAIYQ